VQCKGILPDGEEDDEKNVEGDLHPDVDLNAEDLDEPEVRA
jgi:hypothetical protein